MLDKMSELKLISTHELIEKLQEYEKENGIGTIVGVGVNYPSNKVNEYYFIVSNNPEVSEALNNEDKHNRTDINVFYLTDDTLPYDCCEK